MANGGAPIAPAGWSSRSAVGDNPGSAAAHHACVVLRVERVVVRLRSAVIRS